MSNGHNGRAPAALALVVLIIAAASAFAVPSGFDNVAGADPCTNDADCDGVLDGADNCVAVANPAQTNTDSVNPSSNRPGADALGDACDDDSDGDGYGNFREISIGRDPLTYCVIMRADDNLGATRGDGSINALDLQAVAVAFGNNKAAARENQNSDTAVNSIDLSLAAIRFGQNVSACAPDPNAVCAVGGGGPLTNGYLHCGAIGTGETDVWTFSAVAGDRIGAEVGEVTDNGSFSPRLEILSPTASSLGASSGTTASQLEVVAPLTGTYQVLIGSISGVGSGTYRLTQTNTPGPITIAPGDEGGPLTNGVLHGGAIPTGDLDVWTFTATAGDRIGAEVGEMSDNGSFSPVLRLWAPNGASVAVGSGTTAAQIEASAPITGTYLLLVSSISATGSGTYRLTETNTPGPITVAGGDEGGPLTNGFLHTGAIPTGDLDVWTFSATSGDRIGAEVGEVTDSGSFSPVLRLWGPNGSSVAVSSGTTAAQIEAVAPVTGTYMLLVSSISAVGSGTYRITQTNTSGPITIAGGDEGGPLTNGFLHTGAIPTGDFDVWTFAATSGDRIGAEVGEATDDGSFSPVLRLWAPDGASVDVGSGTTAAQVEAVAPVTGTYMLLVSSISAVGSGTYRLTQTNTPGPITVAGGDEGGPLTNGALHTGAIPTGDLDVWTFAATAGDRIGAEVGEVTDDGSFSPVLRLWAPNGASVAVDSGTTAAQLEGVAPATGTYTLLVSSISAVGSGTYRLTQTNTPGPITVSGGDQGGPLTNGALHTGAIPTGDLDVWTFTATAGDRIGAEVGEVTDNGSFSPVLRLWGPNGASVDVGSGTTAAQVEAVAPVTGTYMLLVSSISSVGSGTYRLTQTNTPGPITVSGGDQGGAVTLATALPGEILLGDIDVWTVSAIAGEHITVHISEVVDNGSFSPVARLWAPNGAVVGSASGTSSATITNVTASLTGTYLILVSSISGVGSGTYQITVTKS